MMKGKICQYLSEIVEEISAEEFWNMMENPPEGEMGDLALPCYGLAKKMHKDPKVIASELTEKLREQKEKLGIERVENVGAYCNFLLEP